MMAENLSETQQESDQIQIAKDLLDLFRQHPSPNAYRKRGSRWEAAEEGWDRGSDAARSEADVATGKGTWLHVPDYWLEAYTYWLQREHQYAKLEPKKNFDPQRFKKGFEKGYEAHRGVPSVTFDAEAIMNSIANSVEGIANEATNP